MPRFTVSKFNDLIARRGRPVQWDRGRRCPCWNPRTRQPLKSCPECTGFGYTYTDMGVFTVVCLSITGNKHYAKFGEWLAGDLVMTFPSSMRVADKDRITLLNAVYQESDVLIKGTRDVVVDSTVTRIIECADQNLTYTQGVDFDLVGAQVVWRTGPPDGTVYTVRYEAIPRYVVWLEIPQVRAVVAGTDTDGTPTSEEMPSKVPLRRWVDWTRPANNA